MAKLRAKTARLTKMKTWERTTAAKVALVKMAAATSERAPVSGA